MAKLYNVHFWTTLYTYNIYLIYMLQLNINEYLNQRYSFNQFKVTSKIIVSLISSILYYDYKMKSDNVTFVIFPIKTYFQRAME